MTPTDPGADAALDATAIAELLSLASRVAGREPIALVDADGRVLAGRSPGDVPRRAHPIVRDGRPDGAVVGTAAVEPELLELVARSLELVEAHANDRTVRARLSNRFSTSPEGVTSWPIGVAVAAASCRACQDRAASSNARPCSS